MADGLGFYIGAGLWATVMVVILIAAIRLSYLIEERSDALRNRTGLPRRAAILHTATNWKVARDPETQALRARMNRLLALLLAGMILFAVAVILITPGKG